MLSVSPHPLSTTHSHLLHDVHSNHVMTAVGGHMQIGSTIEHLRNVLDASLEQTCQIVYSDIDLYACSEALYLRLPDSQQYLEAKSKARDIHVDDVLSLVLSQDEA